MTHALSAQPSGGAGPEDIGYVTGELSGDGPTAGPASRVGLVVPGVGDGRQGVENSRPHVFGHRGRRKLKSYLPAVVQRFEPLDAVIGYGQLERDNIRHPAVVAAVLLL